MIKCKAVVNEESSDAEYWKKKYMEAVKMLQGDSHMQTNSVPQAAAVATVNSPFDGAFSRQVRDYADLLKES